MTIENQLFLARFCQNIYGMQRLGKIWLPAQNLIAFHALTNNTLQQQEITVIFVGTLQYLMVRRVLFRILCDRAGSYVNAITTNLQKPSCQLPSISMRQM